MASTDPKRRTISWVLWLMIVTFVCLAYPLSIGPAAWMADKHLIAPSFHPALEAVYAPLGWLHESGPESTQVLLDWYLALWIG